MTMKIRVVWHAQAESEVIERVGRKLGAADRCREWPEFRDGVSKQAAECGENHSLDNDANFADGPTSRARARLGAEGNCHGLTSRRYCVTMTGGVPRQHRELQSVGSR